MSEETESKNVFLTSDPVFKKMSIYNGEINQLTKAQLVQKLQTLNLDTRGNKDVLRKRLKNLYRNRQLKKSNIKSSKKKKKLLKYLVVIDYEATCEENPADGFRHEIIEFPAILINTRSKQIVDEFHSYVQPTLNPKLSSFCTSLTGIKQETVDSKPKFPEVLNNFECWLETHNLLGTKNFAICCDGPWDMGRFLYGQTDLSGIQFPSWGRRWVNLKKSFSSFYRFKRCNISQMLSFLGLSFEGSPHSGIDDSRNIARIAIRLLKDGACLHMNEMLHKPIVVESAVCSNDSSTVSDSENGSDCSFTESSNSDVPNSNKCDIESNLIDISKLKLSDGDIKSDCSQQWHTSKNKLSIDVQDFPPL